MTEPLEREPFPGESAGTTEGMVSDEAFGAALAARILREQHGWGE